MDSRPSIGFSMRGGCQGCDQMREGRLHVAWHSRLEDVVPLFGWVVLVGPWGFWEGTVWGIVGEARGLELREWYNYQKIKYWYVSTLREPMTYWIRGIGDPIAKILLFKFCAYFAAIWFASRWFIGVNAVIFMLNISIIGKLAVNAFGETIVPTGPKPIWDGKCYCYWVVRYN